MDGISIKPPRHGKVVVVSGPPKSDKEGIVEGFLDSVLDSGHKTSDNVLIFRHPADSQEQHLGRHPVNLITEDVIEIYRRIGLKTGNIIILGAPHYNSDIVELVDAIVRSNRAVFLSGPNLNIDGEPYGQMPSLMALADEVNIAKAPCYIQGCHSREAVRSTKIDGEFVAICTPHDTGNPNAGHLILDLGNMYSGKSKQWAREIKVLKDRGEDPLVLRPLKANRYGEPKGELFSEGYVTLNDGGRVPAILVETEEQVLEYLSRYPDKKELFTDETQFILTYKLARHLIAQGYNNRGTGLQRGFNRQGFRDVPKLMCLADVININYATCVGCGRRSTENQRMRREEDGKLIPAQVDDPLELVGGKDTGRDPFPYEARCLDQWVIRGEPKNKFELGRYVV